jgi:hypothetical protein
MTTKTRIKQLEKASAANGGKPEKIVVMFDAHDEGGLAEFDGVEMTQAEADKLAAALPESVLLVHVIYDDGATAKP